jgi:DNA polymerase/3'-5' exonuclease PolX
MRVSSRISGDEAAAVAAEVVRRCARRGLAVTAVGSVRRGAPMSSDLDFLLVAAGVPAPRLELQPARRGDRVSVAAVVSAGPRKSRVVLAVAGAGATKYYGTDVYTASRAEAPFALFQYTGNRDYNIRVRAHAKRRGWKLNQYGVTIADGPRRGHAAPGSSAVRTERDLARLLGVTYRPPRERL